MAPRFFASVSTWLDGTTSGFSFHFAARIIRCVRSLWNPAGRRILIALSTKDARFASLIFVRSSCVGAGFGFGFGLGFGVGGCTGIGGGIGAGGGVRPLLVFLPPMLASSLR